MKSIFYNFLTLLGFLVYGPDAFSQSKFAVSATATPYYGHSKSTVEAMLPDPDGSGAITSQVLRSEVSLKGCSAGLNGRYSFSKRWSASTGLWFNYFSINKSGTKSRSHNFSIPIIANLQTSERKLSPYFSAGALWNFVTTSRLTIPDFGTVTLKSGRNTSRISLLIGAGGIYHFGDRLLLIAQPTFTYAIPPSNVNTHTYQLGLNAQLMLKL
ncbi:PorT family protein [Dyadobacter sp. CY326]|uniref:PorT family protein n=1 Tax=Dyadobacter sp. CY326 TaxID=2907300 RepID=UPI001F30D5F4|nr:PorT family protein [Dyadobacter sp. CY326]MCE7067140.1 PorT family protein [Dyadobacter sp. CY326]